ncbi:MAG: N-acetylmuramic acid 6-phosphate etherase [Puniceicoccaceae bacterium]|nr:MAG: N-acetylmuramic acid 6-phosphate etherase [Puniceicoccaceae bacterium]
MERPTEAPSPHRHLETLPVSELLDRINREDRSVPEAVGRELDAIAALVEALVGRLRAGGRMFYLGAGTSGRLGVVDASELPPTYGVPPELAIALIAGGDTAIRRAVEKAEDDTEAGWSDLREHRVDANDFVIGITASGTTPYVVGALKACRAAGIATGCITNNPGSPVTAAADYPVAVLTGPEIVTGSTRMKAGTAQKLVLNMISTCAMIRLGRVRDNRMVDMQITNDKLTERAVGMVREALGVDRSRALALLDATGSVRAAIDRGREDPSC